MAFFGASIGYEPFFDVIKGSSQRQDDQLFEYFDSIAKGDMGKIQKFLLELPKKKRNALCAGEHSLCHAVRKNQPGVVKLLLENGVAGDAYGLNGKTALHIAIEMNDTNLITILLNRATTDMLVRPDRVCDTPLMRAVECGVTWVVEELFKRGSSPYYKTYYGKDALHCACIRGDMELFWIVLNSMKNGSKGLTLSRLKSLSSKFDSYLHSAAHGRNVRIVKELVDMGIPVEFKSKVTGRTPIFHAAQYGSTEVFKLLERLGAASNIMVQKDKITPFHLACGSGNVELVSHFVSNGFELDLKDKYGQTGLSYACRSGSREVYDYLIAKGADRTIVNIYGETMLMEAARGGNRFIFSDLVHHGASIKDVDDFGKNFVLHACHFGSISIVEYAVENDIDISYSVPSTPKKSKRQYETGLNGLHFCALGNYTYLAAYFLKHCRSHFRNERGDPITLIGLVAKVVFNPNIPAIAPGVPVTKGTPLSYSVAVHHDDIFDLFITRATKTDINKCCYHDNTAFHEACKRCNRPVALKLLEYGANPKIENSEIKKRSERSFQHHRNDFSIGWSGIEYAQLYFGNDTFLDIINEGCDRADRRAAGKAPPMKLNIPARPNIDEQARLFANATDKGVVSGATEYKQVAHIEPSFCPLAVGSFAEIREITSSCCRIAEELMSSLDPQIYKAVGIGTYDSIKKRMHDVIIQKGHASSNLFNAVIFALPQSVMIIELFFAVCNSVRTKDYRYSVLQVIEEALQFIVVEQWDANVIPIVMNENPTHEEEVERTPQIQALDAPKTGEEENIEILILASAPPSDTFATSTDDTSGDKEGITIAIDDAVAPPKEQIPLDCYYNVSIMVNLLMERMEQRMTAQLPDVSAMSGENDIAMADDIDSEDEESMPRNEDPELKIVSLKLKKIEDDDGLISTAQKMLYNIAISSLGVSSSSESSGK